MRTRLIFAAVFGLLCLPLFLVAADPVRLETLTLQGMLIDKDLTLPSGDRYQFEWSLDGDRDGRARLDALRAGMQLPAPEAGEDDVYLRALDTDSFLVSPSGDGDSIVPLEVLRAEGRLSLVRPGVEEPVTVGQFGSRLALFPPLLAILLAFLLRSTLISLSLGVLLGAFLMLAPGEPLWQVLVTVFYDILWKEILTQSFQLYILGFVLLLSSTVAVVTRMGGIEGMVRVLLRYAKSSRSVQAVAYALGLGIFFDDYANTIIVGNSCGPLFERMKVSRAKLAYIVDSTAAPMAGIAILSTWVAYQISTYAPQLPTVGMEVSQGYSLFLDTIPYRFYCIFALFMVGIVIVTRRDFGPMRRTEEASRRGQDPSALQGSQDLSALTAMRPDARPRWFNGVLPLSLMVFGTAGLIYVFGHNALHSLAADGDADAIKALTYSGFEWLRAVLGESDSTAAIFYGSLAAYLLALVLGLGQRLLPAADAVRTSTRGIRILFKDAVMILILAWSIGAVCTQLGTATYLVAAFQDMITGGWLPILLFVASCFVAFATGSSWTTMAIMQPNVVLLAYNLGEQTPHGSEGLLILSIGAVLEGAIFGDHCSPISDTTILSSTASKCQHIQHVRTQAPYALVVAFVALLLGYLPTSFLNTPPLLSIGLGMVALLMIVRIVGRQTPDVETQPA